MPFKSLSIIISVIAVSTVFFLRNKEYESKILYDYTGELLQDNREEPSNEEFLNIIQQELPNLPLKFLLASAARRKNKSCARYPALMDIKYHNNYWQSYQHANISFQLYGAYYDTRETVVGNEPVVRILAMINQIAEPFTNNYCQLWFNESMEPFFVKVKEYSDIWYKQWAYHNKAYYPHILSCPLPEAQRGLIPQSVSLVAQPCANASNNLKINYELPSQLAPKRGFAICMKGLDFLYNDMSARFVEWLELMCILGASKVFIYDLQLHANISKVLRHYQEQHFVEVHGHSMARGEPSLPNFNRFTLRSWDLNKCVNELIPYNDCFYRNMYKFDYIAVIDLDEVIMPLGNLTSWHHIVEAANGNRSTECLDDYAAICFRNIYYPKYAELPLYTSEIPDYFYMLQHTRRVAEHLDRNYATKCLHNTAHVIKVHNHFPMSWSGDCGHKSVEPSLAQLQHYREPDLAHTLENPVNDANIWRFKHALVNRSMSAFKDLKFFRKVNASELNRLQKQQPT